MVTWMRIKQQRGLRPLPRKAGRATDRAGAWGRVLLLGICLTSGSGCFRQTKMTATIRIPALRSETGAALVLQALAEGMGDEVSVLSVDTTAGKIQVSYDSLRIALRNLQHRIAEAGFDVDDLPANPEARSKLPVDCR